MNKKILFFCALFVVVGLGGCKKDKLADTPDETPKSPEVKVVPEASVTPLSPAEYEEKSKEIIKDLESSDPETAKQFAALLELAKQQTTQTICPIMGGKIEKDIFVEYQGKKVYFCCPPCKAKFNADPKKFLPKLPQFATPKLTK
ncbi:MAG: YHS domain-containing protein [Planctomycetes bacterium]|nr:YHS domain-containing protein [Planctomycetota bacterium]